ncbi:hypothetical protein [Alkalibacillus salilacus]|uniref:O-antigen ligase domain-containing protein n=1 Tax=Alkalibacillus salilacus TaxID=284582 RepID=A0ABT9VHX1_9BACI|nr:hypothetical protein [Alkalibacillus salilacus]MDQ0160558.1 hypothetical protein [Alkalibacillus salilacus]
MLKKFNKNINQIEWILYFVVLVLLFQITRNISTVVYVGVLFSLYILLYIIYLLVVSKNYKYEISAKPRNLIFLFTLLFIPITSIVYLDFNEWILAFPRYLVTLPFIIFLVFYNDFSKDFIKLFLQTLCIYMAIVAVSVFYQIIFGSISFFAEPSYREGLVRYASLAGSLTALGTLGALALAILSLDKNKSLFNNKFKVLLISIISIGMLASLQKAAVVNIMIVISLYLIFNLNIKRLILSLSSLMFLGLTGYIIFLFNSESLLAIYTETIINYTLNTGGIENTQEDLLNRLVGMPLKVIEFHDIKLHELILGIGFAPLAGVMGLSHYPMPHNTYFDLLLSGGIIHLISYVFLLTRITFVTLRKKLRNRKLNIIDRSFTAISVILLINMVIGAGTFYQPIQAVFVFLIILNYDKISELFAT